MDSSKFSHFNITKTSYRRVDDHDIAAYILVPKDAKPGKHPVLVRFHGGYLVTGSALYAEWTPNWYTVLAAHHSAITITPNYRLLPESSGASILSDLSVFWTWLHTTFPTILSNLHPALTADLSHVGVYGESAGAYLAIQSAFTQSPNTFKAIIAAYPLLDLESDFYTKEYEKAVFGSSMLPKSVLEAFLKEIVPGTVISEAEPPARLEVALSMVQQGRFKEFLGTEKDLYPLRILEDAAAAAVATEEEGVKEPLELPFTFLFHGTQDSAVPVEGSRKFVALARQMWGPERILFHEVAGQEHGFDGDASIEKDAWLREGLEGFAKAWLE